MTTETKAQKIARLTKDLARLERESGKLAEARSKLPPGSSRARVTTANARWARVAESRERTRRELADLEGE